MATGIVTGTHSRLLTEGLHEVWGLNMDRYAPEWKPVFEMKTSDKAYEDDQGIYGLGVAPEKDEAASILFDKGGQGFSKRYTMVAYGLGVQISQEAIEDGKYINLSTAYTKELSKSQNETLEVLASNVLNRAFTSTYAGGDGKELCATDHPFMGGGTYQNELTTGASLSETSLEDMLILIDQAKDHRQLIRNISGQLLVIPPQLRHTAHRILKSDKQNDTANNAVNAIRNQGLLPKGFHVMRRLSSATKHFIITDAAYGLTYFSRVPPSFSVDTGSNDEFTIKLRSRMRCAFGWTDPLGVYGNVAS